MNLISFRCINQQLWPLLSLLILPLSASSFDRGINYDPAHSAQYIQAQAKNNLSTMTSILERDFTTIQNLGFNIVKTFDSRYSTIDGKSAGLIADIACPKNIKLMLGVFEFRNPENKCADWCLTATAQEVQDAILSTNKYPGCIIGIAVGNEDITNWNFKERIQSMERRILADIETIKAGLKQPVPVGTAQQDGALLKLASYGDALSQQLISELDFVGANIYPYWDPQYYTEPEGHAIFQTRYDTVKAKFSAPIIVTEEGWPSQHNPMQNPNASLPAEQDYYSWWQSRATTDTFSSYYFSIFDKLPDDNDNGANIYFGLCKPNGAKKILNCL